MALPCTSTPAIECSVGSISKKSFDRFPAIKQRSLSSAFVHGAGLKVEIGERHGFVGVKASSAEPAVSASAEGEIYEVELDKPYGLKFYKGVDGSVYIDALAVGSSAAKLGKITEGDKVIATSAVFGDEMWPAAEYGRTMYTVRNRVGPLIVKLEKKNGVKIEQAGKNDAYALERNAGNYGDAIREKQIENSLKKKETAEQRVKEISEGLQLYKKGQYEEALDKFETVLILQPTDRERAVTGYNMACCYSKLQQTEKGLSALEAAMDAGFEDYKTIRTDPDLEGLRESEEFEPLLKQYDEPFINENAIKAISNIFGFMGGKK